jgi:hypothetical protein
MIYKFFELPRFVRPVFFIGLVLYFVLYGFFVRVTVLVRIVLSFSLVFGFHTLFFSKHLVINSYNKYAILPQHSMILSCDSFE